MKAPSRILILEDDACYAELLSFKLRGEWPACELRLAGNQADFKTAMKREAFDLIISDYSMPQFNGLEALAFVREKHRAFRLSSSPAA